MAGLFMAVSRHRPRQHCSFPKNSIGSKCEGQWDHGLIDGRRDLQLPAGTICRPFRPREGAR